MAYLSNFIYKKEILVVSFPELQNLARKRSKGEGGEKEKGKKEGKGRGESSEVEREEGRERRSQGGEGRMGTLAMHWPHLSPLVKILSFKGN